MNGPALCAGPFMHNVAEHLRISAAYKTTCPSGAIVAVMEPRPRGNDGKGAGVWCVRCFGISKPRTPLDSRLRGNDRQFAR